MNFDKAKIYYKSGSSKVTVKPNNGSYKTIEKTGLPSEIRKRLK